MLDQLLIASVQEAVLSASGAIGRARRRLPVEVAERDAAVGGDLVVAEAVPTATPCRDRETGNAEVAVVLPLAVEDVRTGEPRRRATSGSTMWRAKRFSFAAGEATILLEDHDRQQAPRERKPIRERRLTRTDSDGSGSRPPSGHGRNR